MTLWIGWSLLVSTLVALAATAIDRAAGFLGMPRRGVWLGAMLLAGIAPLVAVTPRTPAPPTPPTPRATSHDVGSARSPAPHNAVDPRLTGVTTSSWRGATPAAVGSPALRDFNWDRTRATLLSAAWAVDPWVVPAWGAASAVLCAFFGAAMLRLRRRRVRWHDAEVGPCRALIAPDAGPAVIGFAHPRIVIPTWALSLDPLDRELLLRHEMEHIAAGDPLAVLAAGTLVIAVPWNAALWWMLNRLRLAAEIDCDARVARAVGCTREYGLLLLAVGERQAHPLLFAASLASRRPHLERRITAMTTPRPRRPWLASLPSVGVAVAGLTVACATPTPHPLVATAAPSAGESALQQPRAGVRAAAVDSTSTSSAGSVSPRAWEVDPNGFLVPAGAGPTAAVHAVREQALTPAIAVAAAIGGDIPTSGITGAPVAAKAAVGPDSLPAPHAVRVPAPVAAAMTFDPAAQVQVAAQSRGEKELDSVLARGRKRPGLRYSAVRLRWYLDGFIGNPFVFVLIAGRTSALSEAQSDTVVFHLTRFQTFKDSTWRAAAMVLAALPDDYDLDAVWSQLLRSADAVIQQMLTDGVAVKNVLSPSQLAHLPVRVYLEPGCAASLHQALVDGRYLVPHADASAQGTDPSGCTVR